MCRTSTCSTCGKTTWAGCGQHVAELRTDAALEEWCLGHFAVSSSELRDRIAAARLVAR